MPVRAHFDAVTMTNERIQRRIDAALDEAEEALESRDWATVLERAESRSR